MEYGAIDLHLRRSQFKIVTEDGTVVQEGKFDTTRAELRRVFGGRARMRVLVESSTESEWVAQELEACGQEVVVGDPNYLPMYGQRSRKVKTDGRDTAALSEACRLGIYRHAHRASAVHRTERQHLRVREHLVQMRSGGICLLRALLRQEGWRLPSGQASAVEARLERLALPDALRARLEPLRAALAALTALIEGATTAVTTHAEQDAGTVQLMTAPGIGPIIATTYQAVLDTPARFDGDAGRVTAFVGLVPGEDSSAERRHKGHITKTGPSALRALLVQASWSIWRGRSTNGTALRTWAHALAARRGRRIAIVALARRLCRIVFAMWRDQREFREPTAPVTA